MLEEDEKDHPTQLPSSDQGQYIDYFQNVAYKVYSSLLERSEERRVGKEC